MRILLLLGAALAFLLARLLMLVAKTAVHEIQAFIMFLISAVCLSGAGVVDAVNTLRSEVRAQQPPRA